MADKAMSYSSQKIEFIYAMQSKADNSSFSQSGTLYLQGDKYKIILDDSELMFDGTALYNYIPDAKEVTITAPEEDYDEFFLSNPSKIFSLYKQDFKYQYIGETNLNGTPGVEIDLFPFDLERSYSRIKLWIDTQSAHIQKAEIIGKGGDSYAVTFNNIKPNVKIADDMFVFSPTEKDGITVVDMRGL
ncbi:MAG: outer membrane lipoprotein carrier protein LolA [Bacteroidales bacterium]|nr:outer membrane lipoprotein carrier protein LolA [Bacteroidales bacterium]